MIKKIKAQSFHKLTLNNKVRLIMAPIDSVKSVTALILVVAGSRYETKEINGISHFLEHMFFKGTKKRPTAFEISSLIDGIGGEFNAFTAEEMVGYYVKASSSHLELVLDVLSDMLRNSKFAQEEIERERGVIIEELNMYEDTPARKIHDIYKSLLYGDQPLGWEVGGQKDVIAKLTRDNFVNYMKDRYKPNNMVISIAGQINPAEVKSKVIKYFGDLKPDKVTKYLPIIEDQKSPKLVLYYKKTDQSHLNLGVRTFKLTDPDRYTLTVLSVILGGGMSSRLFVNVRERRGLAYYVRSIDDSFLDCGTLFANAGVDLKRIDEAIKVILEEFLLMRKKPVHNKELEKAKEFIKGKLILEFEDTRAVASRYGSNELLEKKIHTDAKIIENIDRVSAKDVIRVAKEIFIPEKLNLAIIGPFRDQNHFQKLLKF